MIRKCAYVFLGALEGCMPIPGCYYSHEYYCVVAVFQCQLLLLRP